MKTVTLKIPDHLDAKIQKAVARRKESFSDLARRALAREVEEREVDFARLAAPYRGMFRASPIFRYAKAMEPRNIVDAGPLIGWLNAADQWHKWSVAVLSGRRGPLHTTEIVLAKPAGISAAIRSLRMRSSISSGNARSYSRDPWPEHLAHTQQVMLRYPLMDAADASLVTLAESSLRAVLITTDRRDFGPCRGLRNRALKLILPE
jgi:predicted transcriptional regulator